MNIMQSGKKYDYDVIVIGAGIAGLVCGCYLAKAGLKTLIVEKNPKVGGYCTSFTRKGFHFDACAHALGSLRTGGRLNKVITELGLIDRLNIIRHDPSDIIITPDYKIKIYNSLDKTIEEFQKCFPKEKKQIDDFFKFTAFGNISSFIGLRSKTLKQLLDSYFNDESLKTILSVFILGFVGLLPHQVSSVVACLIYREFVFDGGYCPIGGMQVFPDALAKRFIEFNGDIIYSTMVKKIEVCNNNAKGVMLHNDQYISSKYIISACDTRQTFFELIEDKNVLGATKDKIDAMSPSMSSFLVYLGTNKITNEMMELNKGIWIINNYDMEKEYYNMMNRMNNYLLITTSFRKSGCDDKISVRLESSTPCQDEKDWNEKSSNQLAERFIKMAEQVIPGLSNYTTLKFVATPITLYKWTKNYQGAAFGWASTPKQFGDPDLSQQTKINNLYLTGHWSNQSSGIAFVANCGYDTADLILYKEKIK